MAAVLGRHDAIFAGALGQIHSLVSAADQFRAGFRWRRLCYAGAERDQNFLVALQKKARRQLALQAL